MDCAPGDPFVLTFEGYPIRLGQQGPAFSPDFASTQYPFPLIPPKGR